MRAVFIGLVLFLTAGEIGLGTSPGWASDNSTIKDVSSAVLNKGVKAKGSINIALEAYDRAFQSRNLTALKQLMADDVVMFEQGAKNLGRDDVLNNHLGPELLSFQELSANYSDLRIRESGNMATISRQFSIKAKKQGRSLAFRGNETQSWEFREGRWELVHIHLSFPTAR